MSAEAPWLDAPVVKDDSEPWKSSPVFEDEPWKNAPVASSSPTTPTDAALTDALDSLNIPKELGPAKLATEGTKSEIPSLWEAANTPILDKMIQPGSLADKFVKGAVELNNEFSPLNQISTGIDQITGTKTAGEVMSGYNKGVQHLVEGLSSPLGIETLGLSAAPKLVQNIALGAFAANMAKDLPDNVQGILDATTPEERSQRITETIGSALMLYGMGSEIGGRPSAGGETLLSTRGGEQPNAIENTIATSPDGPLLVGGRETQGTGEVPAAVGSEGVPASGQGTEVPPTPIGKITQILNERQKETDPTKRQALWEQAKSALDEEKSTKPPVEAMPPAENAVTGKAPAEEPQGASDEPPTPPEPPTNTGTPSSPAPGDEPPPEATPAAKGIFTGLRGTLNTVMGHTFPKTTIADRETGEAGARWISSRIYAPHAANIFSASVLGDSGIDPRSFGAALSEDNLRSIKKGFEESGEPDRAAKVGTLIGQKNSPFKTEEDYQKFLQDPAVQQAIQRHIQLWNESIDPMYKQAMMIEPDVELPSRGEQTGARINLHIAPDESSPANRISSVAPGNLLGTLRKKSPFGRQATGTGVYDTNYFNMMENTYGRQLEIANKNAFETKLVESGNAVIDKPGQSGTLTLEDGSPVKEFPLKRQVLIIDGKPVPQSQSIYIRKSLSGEYSRGSNTETLAKLGAISKAADVVNTAALAGLTDATVHVSNQLTALFTRPGENPLVDSLISATGRADIPITVGKTIIKAFQDNKTQLAELAKIGALHEKHGPAGMNPMKMMSKGIGKMDDAVRLVLDDVYKGLAKRGIVEDTETNRREFVNQLGQYNKRAQGEVIRRARESGLGPFATAGRAFNILGMRTVGMSPGVKAASTSGALALRANVLSKWVGAGVAVGTLNYLLTKDKGGGVLGRPGVPLGSIDTGKTDENGRPQTINAFGLMGLQRGLRATGIRGAVEAKRAGLPNALVRDSAYRDAFNTAIGPFSGPIVKFGLGVENQAAGIGLPKPFEVVPPGKSQIESNVKNAVLEANPVIASVNDLSKPGKTTADAIRRQFPRFSMIPSKPETMMKDYPAIVRRAQANGFVDDVIGRARKMTPTDRKTYIKESLNRLDPADRPHAIRTMEERRVIPRGALN